MMQPCMICGRPINTRTETYYTKSSFRPDGPNNSDIEQIYLHPACYREYIEQEK